MFKMIYVAEQINTEYFKISNKINRCTLRNNFF